MEILILIAVVVLGGYLLISNIYEGMCVYADGWSSRHSVMFLGGMTSFGKLISYLKVVLTLPGAILGFVMGIITFRWTDSDWWR